MPQRPSSPPSSQEPPASGVARVASVDQEQADEHMLKEETERMLHDLLSPRERLVLQLRFGLGDSHVYPLEKIGQDLGLTRERVRQLEAQALKKLRTAARDSR